MIVLPPSIKSLFSADLLLSSIERLLRKKDRLLEYANKKIRPQDTRKQVKFAELLTEFNKLYERKVIEEANHVAASRKKNEERSCLHDKGSTVRFTRHSGS